MGFCQFGERSSRMGMAPNRNKDATLFIACKVVARESITLNGFIIDARTLSRELQEIAYRKGLIPYIFADKC